MTPPPPRPLTDQEKARVLARYGPPSRCECPDYEWAIRRGHQPGCPELTR